MKQVPDDRTALNEAASDHDGLDAQLVAERYVLGQLPADEREAFEEHFLDCPTCLDRLELARRMRDGIAEVAAEDSVRAAAGIGFIAVLTRLGRGGRAALAGALLALVLGPSLLLVTRFGHLAELEEALASAHGPQAPAALVVLSPVRTAEASPSTRIVLPATPGWIVFALELRDASFDRYRAVLHRGGEMVWQGGDLAPTAAGEVVLSIHSSWLEAGDHQLELGAETAAGEAVTVTRFGFAITAR